MAQAPKRLLVVGGPTSSGNAGVLDSWRGVVERFKGSDIAVELVANRDEALARLATDPSATMILAEPSLLAGGHAALGISEATLALDTIGEGVGIFRAGEGIVWSNRRMAEFGEAVHAQIHSACLSAIGTMSAQTGTTGSRRGKRTTFAQEDRYFEMICSPVRREDRPEGEVVAVVWDVTQSRGLQYKIDAIDSAGYELARIEDEAVAKRRPADRLKILQDKIIRYSRDLMHFDHFAIRLVDKRSGKLEVVMAQGFPEDALGIELRAEAEGHGISGYVAATGRSYICSDTSFDPRYIRGLDNARSTLTVPLMLFDRVVGVYNIESDEIDSFGEDDRQFAEIFARYVAMALHILDLLVIQRFTTSETVAGVVMGEVEQPLGELETKLQQLRKDHGSSALSADLDQLLANVGLIRESVKECTQGPQSIVGLKAYDPAEGDPNLRGRRVLVADDEPQIRQTIADILHSHGCSVTICENGSTACERLEREDFDLVVSDIRMPDRTGYEVFAAAHSRDESTPVILMTGFGYDPNHSIVRASQEGLSAVVFKPFKIDELILEVRKALTVHLGNPLGGQPGGET